MRPRVLILAPNAFASPDSTSYEVEFRLRTRSGHLASFSNLVRLFNPMGDAPPELDNSWREAPSMAGYYLESFLKLRGYDAHAVFNLERDLESSLTGPRPLALALSTTYLTSTKGLATLVKQVRDIAGPDIPLVAGGPFVWKQALAAQKAQQNLGPESTEYLFADGANSELQDIIFVAHEFGEHTLIQLLSALSQGIREPTDLGDVPNLVLGQRDGTWHFTRPQLEPIDLDADYTRWDLVDEFPNGPLPMRSSVGCSYRCEFCDFVVLHPKVRLRSATSIVEELQLAKQRGAQFINFVDDNAFSSRRRIKDLSRTMCESDLGLRWGGFLRADKVTDENVELLAESGLRYAWCGIESGDPEMLRRMRKQCDIEEALLGIDRLTTYGVNVLATFLLGFPGETIESVDRSIEFLNRLDIERKGPVDYSMFPLIVLPGAPLADVSARKKYNLSGSHETWKHKTMTSEMVRSKIAPYFFRNARVNYSYYSADNSPLWTIKKRNEAIERRRDLVIAFLDGLPSDNIQNRFDSLYSLLHFGNSPPPNWLDILAPREQQPGNA